MFNKKHILVLLLFLIIGICAMSSVSATDNVTDIVASDASDDVVTALEEEEIGEVAADVVADPNENATEIKSPDVLSSSENDSVVAVADSDDVLSAKVSRLQYSVNLNDNGYTISSTKATTIKIPVTPCTTGSGFNAYNFYLGVFQMDNNGNLIAVYKSAPLIGTNTKITSVSYTFSAKSLSPGAYILAAYNDEDAPEAGGSTYKLMDRTVLYVSGSATITADNYNANYYSGQKMSAKVIDKNTNAALKYVELTVTFTKNGASVSQNYVTDANGMISFVPPVGVGTYSVTFSLSKGFNHITASSVKKTATVKQAPVTLKVYKGKTYQGVKVVLSASVTSNGKKVNEGIVTFNLCGVNYNVAVKDGKAVYYVTLKKAKTFTYSATYKGNNFTQSTLSNKIVVNKRFATKILVKNQATYRGVPKKFFVTIKTTNGVRVREGYVTIIDTVKVNKYGNARFYVDTYNWNYLGSNGATHYFKKVVTKTYTVKYTPASLKYLPSTTKMKISLVYRCVGCGKTGTHTHGGGIWYIVSK